MANPLLMLMARRQPTAYTAPLRRVAVPVPTEVPSTDAIFLVLRRMRLGLPDGTQEPTESTQYQAYKAIDQAFGEGLNGTLLGRCWDNAPQTTLYAAAPLWRAGRNEVVVLELMSPGRGARLCAVPDLGPVLETAD